MREVTLQGQWWLPDQPDHKIVGTLTFTGESRPTLRLFGVFAHHEQTSTESYEMIIPDTYTLIYGLTEHHEVTLVDCDTIERSRGSTGQWRQSIRARLLLVGIWLDESDEACFDRITIGVDHLLAWSGHTGFRNESYDPVRVSNLWVEPKALMANVDNANVQISIVRYATHLREQADRNEQAIEEYAAFVVDASQKRSADTLIKEWVKPLQDLLTLATGQACGVYEISLRAQRTTNDVGSPASKPQRPVPVSAYLATVYRARPDDPAIPPGRMLFTLRDISFPDLLPAWLAVRKKLGPVPDMAFGLHYISRSYTENRLITAVAAAEALHRRLRSGETDIDANEFDELLPAALTAVPENRRDWLRDRLRNEPTLKKRLMQLVEQVGTELVAPFMPKPNRWAKAAKDARNSLVHRFPDPSSPTGPEMYFLAQITSAIITLNILREVGSPQGRLVTIVDEHELFRWISEQGPKLMPRLFPAARNHQGR